MNGWTRTVTRYEEVSWWGLRTGNCAVCGKRAKRSRKFSQTVNPFNRHDNGVQRTRREIQSLVAAEAAEWSREPVVHAGCEQ